MKLPNGYGSVTKLSGARRKPWIARKTVGIIEGKQERVVIGCFKTKAEALQALSEYNACPYDVESGTLTFADIYKKWFSETFDEDTNRSTIKNYEAAYKHCDALKSKKIKDIRTADMQKAMNECPRGHSTASRMKIMFGQIYKYCLANDIVKRNYAEALKVKQKAEATDRTRFTPEEIERLWSLSAESQYVQFVLIMIYSGCRINELLSLKIEDVKLGKQYFTIRQAKTASGVRDVPIADKVLPFWKAFLKQSQCEWMFTTTGGKTKLSYDNFIKRYWKPLCANIGVDHVPHETRHTCISMLTEAGVNPTYIKFIVGHKSIMDLTERVYTHIQMSELIEAINKI